MAGKWYEIVTGSLEQKKQYKRDKGRIEALPEPYSNAAKAMHRYLMYCGGIVDGESLTRMYGDLADLWERAAVDGTPVHDIVGDDPVQSAEDFAAAYSGRQWIDKERARLVKAMDDAQKGQS